MERLDILEKKMIEEYRKLAKDKVQQDPKGAGGQNPEHKAQQDPEAEMETENKETLQSDLEIQEQHQEDTAVAQQDQNAMQDTEVTENNEVLHDPEDQKLPEDEPNTEKDNSYEEDFETRDEQVEKVQEEDEEAQHDPEVSREVPHDPEERKEEEDDHQRNPSKIDVEETTPPAMKSPPKKMRRRNPTKKTNSSSRMPKTLKMKKKKMGSTEKIERSSERKTKKTQQDQQEDQDFPAVTEKKEDPKLVQQDAEAVGVVQHDPEADMGQSMISRRVWTNPIKKKLEFKINEVSATMPGLDQLPHHPEARRVVQQDPEAGRSHTMTPEKAWSNSINKKLFTIGRDTQEEDLYVGKVLRAKMTIEEKMKKEMRDRKLEEVRRRIILTPKGKRNRCEDGNWEGEEEQRAVQSGMGDRSQEGSGTIRKLQTPLTSFLVSQTIEERRAAIGKRSARVKNEEDSQMSSYFGSPALRKRGRGRVTGTRKTEEGRKGDSKKEGKVLGIRDYFEGKAEVSKFENKNSRQDNNNAGWDSASLKCTMVCSSVRNETQRETQE